MTWLMIKYHMQDHLVVGAPARAAVEQLDTQSTLVRVHLAHLAHELVARIRIVHGGLQVGAGAQVDLDEAARHVRRRDDAACARFTGLAV